MSEAARIRAGYGSLLLALFVLSLLGTALAGALRARNWAIAAAQEAAFLLFLAFGPVFEAG